MAWWLLQQTQVTQCKLLSNIHVSHCQTPDKLYFSKEIMEIITEGNHKERTLNLTSFSPGKGMSSKHSAQTQRITANIKSTT